MKKLVIELDPHADQFAQAEANECEDLCARLVECPNREDRLDLVRQLLADFTTFDVRIVD